MTSTDVKDQVEHLSLEKAATLLLEECRMVLPGIQALFGFQFVAVFNSGFSDKLSPGEQEAHIAALLCVLIAAALVLAPAAIHRMRQPRAVSREFVELSTKLLAWSMAPLAVGTIVDVYIVAHVVTKSTAASAGAATLGAMAFVTFWVLLPQRVPRQS